MDAVRHGNDGKSVSDTAGSGRGRRIVLAGFRLLVGGLFMFAGVQKLQDPYFFVNEVAAYQLMSALPGALVATIVPWTEVMVGAALIAGVWLSGAFLMSATLLFVFLGAQASAITRGLTIGCGCFGHDAQESVVGWATMGRTAALFVCAIVGLLLASPRSSGWKMWRVPLRRSVLHRALLLPVCLLLVFVAVPAMASHEGSRRHDEDAASTWYARAAEKLQALPEAQRQLILEYAWSNADTPPSAEVLEVLNAAGDALEMIHKGAQHESAAWPPTEWRLINRPNPPQVSYMQDVTHFATALARVRVAQGDSDAASALSDLYQVARHISETDSLSGSMMGVRTVFQADRIVGAALPEGAIGSGGAAALLKSVERFDSLDPVNSLSTMATDYTRTIDAIAEAVRAGDVSRISSFYETMAAREMEGINVDLAKLHSLTPSNIDEEVRKSREFLADIMDVAMQPDRETAKRQVMEMIQSATESGEILLPIDLALSADVLLQAANVTREKLEAREAELRKLAGGEIDSDALRNAATYYLDAIRASRSVRQELFHEEGDEPLRIGWVDASGLDDVPPDQLRAIFKKLDEGAAIRRCDFTEAIGGHEKIEVCKVAPEYLESMRQLLIMTVGDAIRQASDGKPDVAAQRLETAIAMSEHLGRSGPILNCVVAHDALLHIIDAVQAIQTITGLPVDAIEKLRARADRFDAIDPFGYRRARRSVQESLLERARQQLEPAAFDEVEDDLTRASYDGVWSAIVALTANLPAFDHGRRVESVMTAASSFSDLIDMDAMKKLAHRVASEPFIEDIREEYSAILRGWPTSIDFPSRVHHGQIDVIELRDTISASAK